MAEGEKVIRPAFGTVEGGKQSAFLQDGGGDIAKVLSEVSMADFHSLKLSEPKYGDLEIGTLTDEECLMFARFHTVTTRHKEVTRELSGAQLEKIGGSIRSGELDMDRGPVDGENFIDHDLVREYFRVTSFLDNARSMFYHSINLRIPGHWEYKLGVRTKRRIYRAERRY